MILTAMLFCVSTLTCNFLLTIQETGIRNIIFFFCSWIHLGTSMMIAHEHLKNENAIEIFFLVWIDLLYLVFRCQQVHEREQN